MKYLTCSEASLLMGTTTRRVQQMCKNGEIVGAIKKGRFWMVPADAVPNKAESPVSKKKVMPLPVGISDFKQATSDYYYVDKTLLIRDFLDRKPLVSLFTRPRRFGKTLNMDMFRVFFEKTDDDTSKYFQDKLIWQCGEEYTFYQGKFPVMLGLCAVLSNRYQILSNRESGLGRFDIMLVPKAKALPGFIYEFKFTRNETVDLNQLAETALKQIEEPLLRRKLMMTQLRYSQKLQLASGFFRRIMSSSSV